MAVSTVAITRNIHARRFVKFCIVGASSTAVQVLTLRLILWVLGRQTDAILQAGNLAGVCLAILNGFYWNRRWTFRKGHTAGAALQFRRFIAVNLVGLTLNAALFHVFQVRLGLFEFAGTTLQPHANQLLAIAFVVFWNFTANTRWTFNVD